MNQQEQVNEEVKQTSNNMIEVLAKSDNPKHRNSKFLKFLKKLSHGAYTIEDEQLVKKADKLLEFRGIESERVKEEAMRVQEDEQKKAEEKKTMFDAMWNGKEDMSEEQCKLSLASNDVYSPRNDGEVAGGE